jgi:hypothetical protein
MEVLLLLLILAALAVLIVILLRQRRAPSGGPPGAGAAAPPARPADPFAGMTEVSGDPRGLKAGDVAEYLGQRFFVRGSLRFREGGYTWSEHFLDDGAGTKRWVSVEEDPDLEVVMWIEVVDESLRPSEKAVTYGGVDYRRIEHGTATYHSEGTTGLGESGSVEYVDFEGPGGRYLGFERFGGGSWEVGVGERVPNGALTIYPGPG